MANVEGNNASCLVITKDNIDDFKYSSVDIALITVFMPVVFAVGLIGNSMVVYVFLRMEHMRTVTNHFLASLAIADILFLISANPIFWVQYSLTSARNDYGVFGVGACKIAVTTIPDVCFLVSTTTVVLLTVERYLGICWPLKFKTSTKPKALATIALTWALTVLCKSPQIHFAGLSTLCLDLSRFTNTSSRPSLPPTIEMCSFCVLESHGAETCDIWRRFLALDNVLILFTIPLIAVLYYFIVSQLHRQSKSVAVSAASKQQAIRMLIVTVATYIVCVTPFRVLNLLDIWNYQIPPYMTWVLVNVARVLQHLNSAVNPIIYNAMSDKYRRAFKQAFGCFACHLPRNVRPKTERTYSIALPNRTTSH